MIDPSTVANRDDSAVPTLYIIQGFLAAGKSTFSRKLAEETGAMRLNADEWCEANYSAGMLEANWETCFAQAVEHLWGVAKDELAEDRSVIFDMGFWTVASRDHARQRAQDWDVALVHYHITAPDEVLKARLIARNHPMAQANHDNFQTIRALFHEPQANENVIRVETISADE